MTMPQKEKEEKCARDIVSEMEQIVKQARKVVAPNKSPARFIALCMAHIAEKRCGGYDNMIQNPKARAILEKAAILDIVIESYPNKAAIEARFQHTVRPVIPNAKVLAPQYQQAVHKSNVDPRPLARERLYGGQIDNLNIQIRNLEKIEKELVRHGVRTPKAAQTIQNVQARKEALINRRQDLDERIKQITPTQPQQRAADNPPPKPRR